MYAVMNNGYLCEHSYWRGKLKRVSVISGKYPAGIPVTEEGQTMEEDPARKAELP